MHNGSVQPIGPLPAVVIDPAEQFKLIVVINEIIYAKLPQDYIGLDQIHIPIQDKIFLQRAIATGSIRKDFGI